MGQSLTLEWLIGIAITVGIAVAGWFNMQLSGHRTEASQAMQLHRNETTSALLAMKQEFKDENLSIQRELQINRANVNQTRSEILEAVRSDLQTARQEHREDLKELKRDVLAAIANATKSQT